MEQKKITLTDDSEASIPGVDIQKGISMTGGRIDLYRQVLNSFRKDAQERLPILQNTPEPAVLKEFITQVHALKSASASIGAAGLSVKAAKLEAAGKAADIDFIRENLPGFAGHLVELIEGIQTWENAVKEDDVSGGEQDNAAEVMRLLHELAAALEAENAGDIDRLLEELNAQSPDPEIKEAMEKISDNVLMTEFDGALEIIHSLFEKV
jgi:HPt (histidine-containing phosphotransfer) domain-containing protein